MTNIRKGDFVVRGDLRREVLNATGRYITLRRLVDGGVTYYTPKELERMGYVLEESGAQPQADGEPTK